MEPTSRKHSWLRLAVNIFVMVAIIIFTVFLAFIGILTGTFDATFLGNPNAGLFGVGPSSSEVFSFQVSVLLLVATIIASVMFRHKEAWIRILVVLSGPIIALGFSKII